MSRGHVCHITDPLSKIRAPDTEPLAKRKETGHLVSNSGHSITQSQKLKEKCMVSKWSATSMGSNKAEESPVEEGVHLHLHSLASVGGG